MLRAVRPMRINTFTGNSLLNWIGAFVGPDMTMASGLNGPEYASNFILYPGCRKGEAK
jgi:hypothetical protein